MADMSVRYVDCAAKKWSSWFCCQGSLITSNKITTCLIAFFFSTVKEAYYLSFYLFIFWIQENFSLQKNILYIYSEWVKLQLFQTLIKGARLYSNSRPAMQISSLLLSRYVLEDHIIYHLVFILKNYLTKLTKIVWVSFH